MKHLASAALISSLMSWTCLAQIPAFPDEEGETETVAAVETTTSAIFDPQGTEAIQAKIDAEDAKPDESEVQEVTPLGEGEYYTAYNLWYEQPEKLYSINYKKGRLVPAGTRVDQVSVKSGRRGRISFRHIDYDTTYTILLQAKFHPKLTIDDIRERLLTDQPISVRMANMSDVDKEGIEKGVVLPGMSKDAVLISFGYPPEHRTASTKMKDWYYWMHRFRSERVTFDEKDIATVGISE